MRVFLYIDIRNYSDRSDPVTNPVEQLLINAFLNMLSLILAVLGGLYCDKVGRRPLFLISTAGMLLFFTLQTICTSQYAIHGNKAAGNSVVAFICMLCEHRMFDEVFVDQPISPLQRCVCHCVLTSYHIVSDKLSSIT